MATDEQILGVLRSIDQHVKTSASNSTKVMANNAEESQGGAKETPLEKSNIGLLKAQQELKKAIKKQSDAIERAARIAEKEEKQNAKTAEALKRLRDQVEEQIGQRKRAGTISKNAENILDELGDAGKELKTTFGQINDKNKGEFLTAISEAERELTKLADAAKKVSQQETKNVDELQKYKKEQEKKFWADFRKNMARATALMAARGSQAAIEAQGTGFQFAEGVGAGQGVGGVMDTLGGMFGASVEAFASGASIEEVQRFASQNRAALTMATQLANNSQTSMLTAQEGMAAVETYGDQLKNAFGLRGAAQLQAIGQSLTILTNLGVKPTAQGLQDLGQSVENLTRTTNMSATEIFAEFQNLAEDSDFQAFFLALGGAVDPAQALGDSFLMLQKTVGLNLKEFIAYQKFLAQQRQRTGSERVVQAAFAGQLAEGLGMSGSDLALLRQGTAFRESLTEAQGQRFDQIFNQLGVDVAERRAELTRAGDVEGLQALDILMRRAGLPEQIGVLGRNLSGVNQAAAQAQDERVAASMSETEAVVQLNSTIRELIDGFVKSPLAGVGFFGEMTTAVFKGTLAGTLASNAVGKAGLAIGGVLGALGLGAAAGTLLNLGIEEAGQAITGEEDWSVGKQLFDWFGDSGLSEREKRIRAIEQQILDEQSRIAAEHAELTQQRADAVAEGNATLAAKLDEEIAILKAQYEEQTKRDPEKILAAESRSGRNRRDGRGR